MLAYRILFLVVALIATGMALALAIYSAVSGMGSYGYVFAAIFGVWALASWSRYALAVRRERNR